MAISYKRVSTFHHHYIQKKKFEILCVKELLKSTFRPLVLLSLVGSDDVGCPGEWGEGRNDSGGSGDNWGSGNNGGWSSEDGSWGSDCGGIGWDGEGSWGGSDDWSRYWENSRSSSYNWGWSSEDGSWGSGDNWGSGGNDWGSSNCWGSGEVSAVEWNNGGVEVLSVDATDEENKDTREIKVKFYFSSKETYTAKVFIFRLLNE